MKNKNLFYKKLNKILWILFGTLIMAIGTFLFNVPSNIAAGGVTGFSQVIKHLYPAINIGFIMGALNLLLFALGSYFLGKEFGIFTVIGAGAYTLFMGILDYFITVKEPILKDTLANLALGAISIGVGLSFVFRQNASTGGTDVLAKIIEKYSEFSVSKGMLIVDTSIIIFAGTVFGLQSGIYSFISLYITAYVLDVSIAGFNSKIAMTIISNHVEVINNYVMNEINRGTTLYLAKGGYTKNEKEILVTVVDKKQYVKIRNFIKSIDDDAFVYISNINEVYGYGFSREFNHVEARENAKIKN